MCRGTDYLSNRPKNHPVQPEPQEAIRKAREVMREHHCRRIYLATEDEDIYRQFREAFGDALQVTKAKRSENIGHENINDAMMKGEQGAAWEAEHILLTFFCWQNVTVWSQEAWAERMERFCCRTVMNTNTFLIWESTE